MPQDARLACRTLACALTARPPVALALAAVALLACHAAAQAQALEPVSASPAASSPGAQPPEPPDSAQRESGGSTFRFAGYNKAFAIDSRSYDTANDRYSLALNRTRFKLTAAPLQALELHLENDTEWRAGNYLKTAQARAEPSLAPRQYLHLRSTWSDGDDQRLTNDFFRAYARLSGESADLWVGRQRIPLGSGRLWSTLDMLNPINPLQLEREELVGVDAVQVEQRLGSLSKLSVIYAPQPGGGPPRWVGRYRTHLGESDVSGTMSRFWGDDSASVDVATQLAGFGVRGEFTFTRPSHGRRYASAVLGIDYAFENTFTFTLESYLSSQPRDERESRFNTDALRSQVQPVGKRYMGLLGSYEFTPLLKATVVLLANLSDRSRAVAASLAWSAREDLILEVGLQRFSGSASSEYGRAQPITWLSLQWFF